MVLIGAALLAASFAGWVIFRVLRLGQAVIVLLAILLPLTVQVVFGGSLLRKWVDKP
jgi:hypothetical protein